MQTDRKKIREILSKYFDKPHDDPIVIKCAEEILTGKRGDMMDGALLFMQTPEQAQEKEILDELERELKVNYKRDENKLNTAKLLRLEMKANPQRTIARWLAWCKTDEWRLGHLNIYKDITKVWAEWPQQDIQPVISASSRRLPPMRD